MRSCGQIFWIGFIILILFGTVAYADFIMVNTIDDVAHCDCSAVSGCCSLRNAIATALSSDIVTFSEHLDGLTITLVDGQLVIDKHLTIDGDRNDNGTPDITISGNHTSRVFFLEDSMIVTLEGLTIRDGTGGGVEDGAGIYIGDGNLTNLKNSDIIGNSASEFRGGGIFNGSGALIIDNCRFSLNHADIGGAIYNLGSVIISASHIQSNSAKFGGGIYNAADASLYVTLSYFLRNSIEHETGDPVNLAGAGICNSGMLIVNQTTFSLNSVFRYPFHRIGYGGGVYSSGTATIRETTFDVNSAELGGAIHNLGALTLENCTLNENRADLGGGIYNSTSVPSSDTLVIRNSTIYRNIAYDDQGGGIYLAFASGGDGEHITNTIIASNNYINPNDCCIDFGTLETNANNLIQDGSCSPAISGDPMLGDLNDNGGPTATHALLAGSPAINAGSNTHLPSTMTTDQRGKGHPRIQDGTVDIGAFEFYEPTMFPIRTRDGKTVIIMF